MKFKENRERIEGRIYQHDLALKQVQNPNSDNFGKDFISGNIEVAVDEAGLNVIPVHFTYVTEVTSTGKKNATFSVLKKIIEEGKTVVTYGMEEATKVRIDTALGLNDFYTQDDTLVSVKVNESGFVSIINELSNENERNTFSADMVITGVTKIEADEEKNIKDPYVIVRGAIFNFKGALLPLDFVVKNPLGMKYFEELGVSNAEPVYTKVWGKINCETKTTVVEEESAFGEAAVKTYERKTKEWVITGTAKVSYDFGDEDVLTAEELTKAMQDRELMLAEVKKRSEEYRAQKAAAPAATTTATTGAKPSNTTVSKGTFNF